MKRLGGLFGRPAFLRSLHGWLTLAWAVLLVPSVLWWRDSLVWVVVMSAWANFAGHFSSWQAARVEVKQQDQIDEVAEEAEAPTVVPLVVAVPSREHLYVERRARER